MGAVPSGEIEPLPSGAMGDEHFIKAAVPHLIARSQNLDVTAVKSAAEIRLEAMDPRTGRIADSTTSTSWNDIKAVRRTNPHCVFALRIVGDTDEIRTAREQMGEPGYSGLLAEGFSMQLFGTGGGRFRQMHFMTPGQVFAWFGITVLFPRDPNGSATIRDALVVVVER